MEKKASSAGEAPKFIVNGQYIKDLSFENPKAPASLFGVKEKPKIDLALDLKARKVQEKTYELEMQISAKANTDEMPLFVAELTYCGVFTLPAVAEDAVERVVLTDCAQSLYPFARRVLADTIRDGGFPPFLLEPIDFASLYNAKKAQAGSQPKAAVN